MNPFQMPEHEGKPWDNWTNKQIKQHTSNAFDAVGASGDFKADFDLLLAQTLSVVVKEAILLPCDTASNSKLTATYYDLNEPLLYSIATNPAVYDDFKSQVTLRSRARKLNVRRNRNPPRIEGRPSRETLTERQVHAMISNGVPDDVIAKTLTLDEILASYPNALKPSKFDFDFDY